MWSGRPRHAGQATGPPLPGRATGATRSLRADVPLAASLPLLAVRAGGAGEAAGARRAGPARVPGGPFSARHARSAGRPCASLGTLWDKFLILVEDFSKTQV